MKLYKILSYDGCSCHGGNAKWSLPVKNEDGTWTPGEWMPSIKGNLVSCRNGYHLCRPQDLLLWLGDTIYEAEYRGKAVKEDDKVVVRECRLLRRIETWDTKKFIFGCECALHVLYYFENEYPDDGRLRCALQVAKQYANREVTYDAWKLAVISSDAVLDKISLPDKPGISRRKAALFAAHAAVNAVIGNISAAAVNARVAASVFDRDAVNAEKTWQTKLLFEMIGEPLDG